MSKKKILIVTRNLPPLIGGMERLNWHIADELGHANEILLLSHKEAQNTAPQHCNFYGVRLNPLSLFLIFAFIKTFLICLIKKPDVLFAGSGLTAPIVVFWAKIFRKKSIVYIHGLDIATNHPAYNLIWVPSIRRANKVIANSTPTLDICIKKGIRSEKLAIIHPGVKFPPQERDQQLIHELKSQYHLENKKVLISVGRLTQRKGLNEFIDLSFSQIVKKLPQTILIIIGETPTESLNKNIQSKELILSTVRKHNIESNIIFIGNISNDKLLSSFYYLADLHIFPVKHIPEDPEGFGMVAIEAATHGTPTIAFATGGVIDAVEDCKTGYLIKKDNYSEFTTATLQFLRDDLIIDQKICQQNVEKFAWYNLRIKLRQLMES